MESEFLITYVLKAQCRFIRAVKAVDLNRPIIPPHQDIIHSVTNNIIVVNAKNSWETENMITLPEVKSSPSMREYLFKHCGNIHCV